MNMSQIKTKQSKTSTVLEKLRLDLVSGYFDPGQKLQMEQLKERYEVGYSPLREALSRLVSHGLVSLEDLCGFSVPALSLEELYDLYAVRMQIETRALELSMHHGDEHWEADVIACWHRYAKYLTPQPNKTLDLIEWNAFQKEFTFTLIKACQSPWLLKIQDMLYDHSSRYRFLCLGRHHNDEKVLAEFRQENDELVTAVLARNKEKAIQISQSGWDSSIKIMADSLKE
ncbi:FCD domain-containing protein [Legionella anisa]|uniref:GntR family transcriptional regulator n=2 Tax=Legionella anisa TaxID=28082 RepID=A0AAX0WPS1_9GAMM|nr:GntR family transcriptional regulator [Legionella anisa]KTC76346.1 HTH-type transcriptional repressor CsiR [Legionella anisa]PNL60531.1 GntR family transcriptional regulator [Legionella anisa]UAK80705.1 FCD domain-containing protein [Legionella anisa]